MSNAFVERNSETIRQKVWFGTSASSIDADANTVFIHSNNGVAIINSSNATVATIDGAGTFIANNSVSFTSLPVSSNSTLNYHHNFLNSTGNKMLSLMSAYGVQTTRYFASDNNKRVDFSVGGNGQSGQSFTTGETIANFASFDDSAGNGIGLRFNAKGIGFNTAATGDPQNHQSIFITTSGRVLFNTATDDGSNIAQFNGSIKASNGVYTSFMYVPTQGTPGGLKGSDNAGKQVLLEDGNGYNLFSGYNGQRFCNSSGFESGRAESGILTGTYGLRGNNHYFSDSLYFYDEDYGESIMSVCGQNGDEYGLAVFSYFHAYGNATFDSSVNFYGNLHSYSNSYFNKLFVNTTSGSGIANIEFLNTDNVTSGLVIKAKTGNVDTSDSYPALKIIDSSGVTRASINAFGGVLGFGVGTIGGTVFLSDDPNPNKYLGINLGSAAEIGWNSTSTYYGTKALRLYKDSSNNFVVNGNGIDVYGNANFRGTGYFADNITQANTKAILGTFTTGVTVPIYQVWNNDVIYSGPYNNAANTTGGSTIQFRYGRGNDSGNAIILDGANQTYDARSLSATWNKTRITNSSQGSYDILSVGVDANPSYKFALGYQLVSGNWRGNLQSYDNNVASTLQINPDGGNVLIGTTTNGTSKLQVNGDSTFTGSAKIIKSSTSQAQSLSLWHTPASTKWSINSEIDGNGWGNFYIGSNSTTNFGNMANGISIALSSYGTSYICPASYGSSGGLALGQQNPYGWGLWVNNSSSGAAYFGGSVYVGNGGQFFFDNNLYFYDNDYGDNIISICGPNGDNSGLSCYYPATFYSDANFYGNFQFYGSSFYTNATVNVKNRITIAPWDGAGAGGGWINMPTASASGIGTGGAGSNAWIAYAAGGGQWFSDAQAGDVCYRNNTRMLFGCTGGGNSHLIFASSGISISAALTITGSTSMSAPLTMSSRIVQSTTTVSGTTQTINATNCNNINFTATANTTLTLSNGVDNQSVRIRFIQGGSAGYTLTITNANFGTGVVDLSGCTQSTVGKYAYVGLVFNGSNSKWDVVSVASGYTT